MPRLTRGRAGFSLPEVLIVLAVLGVVGTVIANIMLGQQRFYQRSTVQMDMRRELRSTMNLVPADLRSVSTSGGDLIDFTTNSMTFRAVSGVSIVCERNSDSQITLPPTDMARNVLTSWASPPLVNDTIWAFDDGLSRGAEDDAWRPLRITAVNTSTAACPGVPYVDPVLDAAKLRYQLSVTPNLPDSVRAGAALRFTRSMRYALEAQASGRWYLTRAEYRAGAWGASVPVSGPFVAPMPSGVSGIRFAMFDSLGAAITSPLDSRRVSRVDLRLQTDGERSSGLFGTRTTVNNDSTLFRIALRNRQ